MPSTAPSRQEASAPVSTRISTVLPPAGTALPRTDSTIDRALVHRSALSEVFVTAMVPDPRGGTLASAQLPRSHAYWGDHSLAPACHDPVLLMEVCRQAALAASHLQHGVPRTDKFILTHQDLRITRPELLARGTRPTTLLLRLDPERVRERDGRTTGVDYVLTLAVADGSGAVQDAGRATVGLRFKAAGEYQELRLRGREGRSMGSTADFATGAVAGEPVAAPLVGRRLPENAVLLDVTATGRGATSTLRIAGDHPSLFDHPQDHLPGMVLIEGARQLALYTVREHIGLAPGKVRVQAVDARYERFAELDSPLRLEALLPDWEALLSGAPIPVEVLATQDGAANCRIVVDLELACR